MTAINTKADSLRRLLTGATSDGGAQTDPNLSLGGYRSNTRDAGLVIVHPNDIASLTIDYMSESCLAGIHTLTIDSSEVITFTPSGGVAGDGVTLTSGETAMIESSDPNKYVIITRNDAVTLIADSYGEGVLTATNTLVAMGDVHTSEGIVGSSTFRAMALHNPTTSAINDVMVSTAIPSTTGTLTGTALGVSGAGHLAVHTVMESNPLNGWPSSGFVLITASDLSATEVVYYKSKTNVYPNIQLEIDATCRGLLGSTPMESFSGDTISLVQGLRLGLEASYPAQVIANQHTAPESVVMSYNDLTVGTIGAGETKVLWIERVIAPNSVSVPAQMAQIDLTFSTV